MCFRDTCFTVLVSRVSFSDSCVLVIHVTVLVFMHYSFSDSCVVVI